MTPRPVVGPLAAAAYEEMEPVHRLYDEARGWPLLKFLHAYFIPLQTIDDIVRERDDLPGWGILFDPDQCPVRYLPFLAMWAGVRITEAMSEAEVRARIKTRPQIVRCTPGALVQAAKDNLTGAKKVILRERYDPDNPNVDSPGHFEVITYTDETPDPEAVRVAMLEQKDVGLIMHYRVVSGQDWQQLVNDYPTWQDVIDAYPTWQDVIEDNPS